LNSAATAAVIVKAADRQSDVGESGQVFVTEAHALDRVSDAHVCGPVSGPGDVFGAFSAGIEVGVWLPGNCGGRGSRACTALENVKVGVVVVHRSDAF
jgi:hypothetical protein